MRSVTWRALSISPHRLHWKVQIRQRAAAHGHGEGQRGVKQRLDSVLLEAVLWDGREHLRAGGELVLRGERHRLALEARPSTDDNARRVMGGR